jgi:hypothetical protein
VQTPSCTQTLKSMRQDTDRGRRGLGYLHARFFVVTRGSLMRVSLGTTTAALARPEMPCFFAVATS